MLVLLNCKLCIRMLRGGRVTEKSGMSGCESCLLVNVLLQYLFRG
jgi:hypothetical protein